MVKKSKILLEKCFIINKDYTLLIPQHKQTNDTRGGDNKQTILLNICTFTPFRILNAQRLPTFALINRRQVGVLNVQKCKLFLCKGWNQKSQ